MATILLDLAPGEMDLLTPEELAAIDDVVYGPDRIFKPLPGPQTMAYYSRADIVGYGGAAGSGKSMLAIGKAVTQHRKIMILRREATQLTGIIDELTTLIGSRDGYNGQDKIWRLPGGVQIEFGSLPHPGDETKYMGRPHDLKVFDEASNFLEHQVRFLLGWLRSTDKTQRCQALLTFNPPTTAEGQWIKQFFAPWLDRNHPRPAAPGELRWYTTQGGQDVEAEPPPPGADVTGSRPLSRTFIPARVTDNPYLIETGYRAHLEALPEPLRSQMLYGDFDAGMTDDPWQVIPTAWIDAAVARWQPKPKLPEMMVMGVDVARGGQDATVIACRHAAPDGSIWIAPLLTYPGVATPDGPTIAGLVVSARRDKAPVAIDVVGVGSSPYDFLRDAGVQIVGVSGGEKSLATDQSGRLRMRNSRSAMWWAMREAFDPASNTALAIPPDKDLILELATPKWSYASGMVTVESRENIIKAMRRSPDRATALAMALMEVPKVSLFAGQPVTSYSPYSRSSSAGVRNAAPVDYDPYARI